LVYLVVAIIFGLGLLAIFLAIRLARLPQEVQEVEGDEIMDRYWTAWHHHIAETLQQREFVTPGMLTQIPRVWRKRALQRYVDEHPEDDLILRESPMQLELAQAARLRSFLKDWELARARLDSPMREGYESFERQTSLLTDHLCHILGFTRLHSRSYKDLYGYLLRAPTLRLRLPPSFPIIFLKRRTFTRQDIEDLISLMSLLEATSYFALLVPFAQVRELRRLVSESACDFIVLSLPDLRRLFMARDPERRLVEIILDQVDITVISPYVTSGPVPENMFFGRDYEIKTITRLIKERNFALEGGRKIGKTSLLHKVHRILSDVGGYYVLYLDCQAVRDYRSLCAAMEAMWQAKAPESTPTGIQALFAAIHKNRPAEVITILLDEVDALLQHDQRRGWELARILRALTQEGYIRFVFCGERVLDQALHDPASPFFNFCDVIRLGYLDARDVQRIILEPMAEMGLEVLEPEGLVERMMDITSGHPNLVQYLCRDLIVLANKRRGRSISLADLERASQATSFQDYFLETIWGNTNPLERLITLLLPDEGVVTVAQVQELLHGKVSIAQVGQALDFLVLVSILEKRGRGYTFLNRSFKRIVRESQDVETLIQQFEEKLS